MSLNSFSAPALLTLSTTKPFTAPGVPSLQSGSSLASISLNSVSLQTIDSLLPTVVPTSASLQSLSAASSIQSVSLPTTNLLSTSLPPLPAVSSIQSVSLPTTSLLSASLPPFPAVSSIQGLSVATIPSPSSALGLVSSVSPPPTISNLPTSIASILTSLPSASQVSTNLPSAPIPTALGSISAVLVSTSPASLPNVSPPSIQALPYFSVSSIPANPSITKIFANFPPTTLSSLPSAPIQTELGSISTAIASVSPATLPILSPSIQSLPAVSFSSNSIASPPITNNLQSLLSTSSGVPGLSSPILTIPAFPTSDLFSLSQLSSTPPAPWFSLPSTALRSTSPLSQISIPPFSSASTPGATALTLQTNIVLPSSVAGADILSIMSALGLVSTQLPTRPSTTISSSLPQLSNAISAPSLPLLTVQPPITLPQTSNTLSTPSTPSISSIQTSINNPLSSVTLPAIATDTSGLLSTLLLASPPSASLPAISSQLSAPTVALPTTATPLPNSQPNVPPLSLASLSAPTSPSLQTSIYNPVLSISPTTVFSIANSLSLSSLSANQISASLPSSASTLVLPTSTPSLPPQSLNPSISLPNTAPPSLTSLFAPTALSAQQSLNNPLTFTPPPAILSTASGLVPTLSTSLPQVSPLNAIPPLSLQQSLPLTGLPSSLPQQISNCISPPALALTTVTPMMLSSMNPSVSLPGAPSVAPSAILSLMNSLFPTALPSTPLPQISNPSLPSLQPTLSSTGLLGVSSLMSNPTLALPTNTMMSPSINPSVPPMSAYTTPPAAILSLINNLVTASVPQPSLPAIGLPPVSNPISAFTPDLLTSAPSIPISNIGPSVSLPSTPSTPPPAILSLINKLFPSSLLQQSLPAALPSIVPSIQIPDLSPSINPSPLTAPTTLLTQTTPTGLPSTNPTLSTPTLTLPALPTSIDPSALSSLFPSMSSIPSMTIPTSAMDPLATADPNVLLNKATTAVQVVQVIAAVLRQDSGVGTISIPGVGVGLGSNNELVRALIGVVHTLLG